VVALDAVTGRDRWRHELTEPLENETQGRLEGGLLGLLTDGVDRPLTLGEPDLLVATRRPYETTVQLTDLDARTGQRRWSLEMTEAPAPDAPWVEWTVSGPHEPLCHSHGTIDGNHMFNRPKPAFRWRMWPMAGGALRDGAPGSTFPSHWPQGGFESLRDLLEPVKKTGPDSEGLPSGPFRWRPTE
jgi:hypothetical protein